MEEETKKKRANVYKTLIQRAKEVESAGNLEAALHFYEKASLAANKDLPNLTQRIQNLKVRVDNFLQDRLPPREDGFSIDKNSGDYCLPGGFRMPADIYKKLFWYQLDGVKWAWNLYLEGEGGILGDDMGLGKTVQTLAFLGSLFNSELISYALLVVPVAVMEHWKTECKRWMEGIKIKTFHGTKAKREKCLQMLMKKGGICLTTYGMVTTNFKSLDIDWDYVVLDEGHKIKNEKTKLSNGLRQIPSRNRLILTGTPISNNLQEMWALFDYACEGRLLGTLKMFKTEFEDRIIKARDRNAPPHIVELGGAISDELNKLITPYFLRREKRAVFENLDSKKKKNPRISTGVNSPIASPSRKDLLDRPCVESPVEKRISDDKKRTQRNQMKLETRKNDFIIWLTIQPAQLELYRAFLNTPEINSVLNDKKTPLAAISVLKKICDHLDLLDEKMKSLQNVDWGSLKLGCESNELVPSDFQPEAGACTHRSGKLMFLMKLLQNLEKEGHRVLIFSQSRKMLDIIEKLIRMEYENRWLRIDGKIADTKERQKRIDLFNQNASYFCFLLTTGVGGQGISLTSADRVVIFDPAWNSLDDQAADRAYRLGQTKNVVIYRLISSGTIEEKIYRKQVFKRALFKTVIDKKSQYRYFTDQELRELFILGDPQYSETQKQLAELHSHERTTDEELEKHLEFLHSLGIVGISDHDLLFTKAVEQREISVGTDSSIQMIADKARQHIIESATPARLGFGFISSCVSVAKAREIKDNKALQQHLPSKCIELATLFSPEIKSFIDLNSLCLEQKTKYNQIIDEARSREIQEPEEAIKCYMNALNIWDGDVKLHAKIVQMSFAYGLI